MPKPPPLLIALDDLELTAQSRVDVCGRKELMFIPAVYYALLVLP
jgi:hypothetical protein